MLHRPVGVGAVSVCRPCWQFREAFRTHCSGVAAWSLQAYVCHCQSPGLLPVPQAIALGFCDSKWGTAALLLPCLCRQAHAIVVTFAVNQTETLNHVGEVWMPRLQQLGVTVPVILAGLKCDILREEDHLHQVWDRSQNTSGHCAIAMGLHSVHSEIAAAVSQCEPHVVPAHGTLSWKPLVGSSDFGQLGHGNLRANPVGEEASQRRPVACRWLPP